jgi:hypothetical protein
MQVGFKNTYDFVKVSDHLFLLKSNCIGCNKRSCLLKTGTDCGPHAFSETDMTEDMNKVTIPVQMRTLTK